MKTLRIVALLAVGLGLSACASVDTASRNAPMELPQMTAPATQVVSVQDYNIKVSRALRVSEANSYYPLGDIVWRGGNTSGRRRSLRISFTLPESRRHHNHRPVVDRLLNGLEEDLVGSFRILS